MDVRRVGVLKCASDQNYGCTNRKHQNWSLVSQCDYDILLMYLLINLSSGVAFSIHLELKKLTNKKQQRKP